MATDRPTDEQGWNPYPAAWQADAREREARRVRWRRVQLLLALLVLALLAGLVLSACNPPEVDEAVAVTGDPSTIQESRTPNAGDTAEVLALAEQVPATTTTTAAPPTTVMELEQEPREEPRIPAPTTPATTAPPAPAPTTPPTTSAPAPEPEAGQLHPAIAAAFGTGQLGHQAQRVAACESELDAGAVSPTNDHGLFQIHRPVWDNPDAWDGWQQTTGTSWSSVYDAHTNARFARALYDRQGWEPWTCRHAA